MSLHIHRFVDLIKAAESRNQKDIQISLRDAKDLHGDITKLLLTLEDLRRSVSKSAEPIEIEIGGGSFKND
jgi:hypothetical protein